MPLATQPRHLPAQLDFLIVCDQLKAVTRTTHLHDGSRLENSAEHSWHLALMAMTLAEYAPGGTDLSQVIRLLLVHDLVEIGAGDTHFDTDTAQLTAQATAEAQAARQLFGLLPADQAQEFLAIWEEFEAQATPEARFARALDALHPMLLTWGQAGRVGVGCQDRYPELTVKRVLQLKEKYLAEFPALWQAAQDIMAQAEMAGVVLQE
ncbi:HD domain-containing protein [Deinococcus radiophilus]|uniref:HD domain-containing protein n=1 Tax=Deinococcus radiophilus TaxID=32062 RepID=A0A431W624_9DEIO|nr:HD domain-containing protein [Deinococcus radiophilus]RTR30945.1 HD domain-containing protein [Deinococcus radiophilus]UFA49530.1 HD domain-containing protein [Deinococcus radiophilus]